MDNNYIGSMFFVFLVILSITKYNCINKLRENITEYLSDCISKKTIEEPDEIIEIEELTDILTDLIIKNKKLFYKSIYNEPTGQSGDKKVS
jgi:hypothetical protein